MNIFKAINERDFKTGGPKGFIQWKGTNVCMDVFCECGHHGHFDGDFFYFFECSECGKKYAVGPTVKLIALNEEEIKQASNFQKDQPSEY